MPEISLYDSLSRHRAHLEQAASAAYADGRLDWLERLQLARQFAQCSYEILQEITDLPPEKLGDQVHDAAGKFFADVIAPRLSEDLRESSQAAFVAMVDFCWGFVKYLPGWR